MELNRTKKWFYAGTLVTALLILVMGSWWLYLVFTLARKLEELRVPELRGNLVYMIQWEGVTFFVLLLLLTLGLIYLYIMDSRKSRAISAFFASLGHELKTPLTSIRLQGQVIAELAGQSPGHAQLEKYVERLKQDTIRLENELEKSLQLSRLEIGGNLNPVSIELADFIARYAKGQPIELNIEVGPELTVFADESALGVVIKNLIENTIKHGKAPVSATIAAHAHHDSVHITYSDSATFTGDVRKLGQLFYKHNSPKGSGIGLYLITRLARKMNGQLDISDEEGQLVFDLHLPIGEQHE